MYISLRFLHVGQVTVSYLAVGNSNIYMIFIMKGKVFFSNVQPIIGLMLEIENFLYEIGEFLILSCFL